MQRPTEFSAYNIGFTGPCYWVELKGDQIMYATARGGEEQKKEKLFTPTGKDWEKFDALMKKAKLDQWKSYYENPDVQDGSHWKVHIKYAGEPLDSEGVNAYPARKQFDMFLQAVKVLIQGSEF